MIEFLPSELLLKIVETSFYPLFTYTQLLSLSHAPRTIIRGTLREMSFEEPDSVLSLRDSATVTTDVLAALIVSLGGASSIFRAAPTACTNSWVEEAFAGHDRLAILVDLPSSDLFLPTAELILNHLPCLGELHLRGTLSTRFLATVARACPNLQALRCSVVSDPPDVAALLPLAGSLQQFHFGGSTPFPSVGGMAALVRSLSAVWRLKICGCPSSALEPIAGHLTRLTLDRLDDLPGPWLCRLERLSMSPRLHSFPAPLASLLAANQATLSRVALTTSLASQDLVASLNALPRLTHLKLSGSLPDLPPALLDRLVRLTMTRWERVSTRHVRIASSSLQELRLLTRPGPGFRLSLRCPSLVTLFMPWLSRRWPGQLVELDCPRLRSISGVPEHFVGPATAMPQLEAVRGRCDPGWLAHLMADAPRLRELHSVLVHSQPDPLARLCASSSLVNLWLDLDLDVAKLPSPLVLRLPGQLERLGVFTSSQTRGAAGGENPPSAPFDIQVEAPGLRFFRLSHGGATPAMAIVPVRLRLRACPSLVVLHLSPPGPVIADLDEGIALRGLHLEGKAWTAAPESVLGCMTRHGARLHRVWAVSTPDVAVWTQLVGALCGLPHLTSLCLSFEAPELSLACPQLRVLELLGMATRLLADGNPVPRRLVLACPLLEELVGCIGEALGQLEFSLPAPNLRCIRKVNEPWRERLAVMCPGACLYGA
ncbi:hypothetical protein PAPYR_1291 [Paratrimastix pyriformis]|uniref:F-box domain-containing protein n=1 Tax=Paratrimastix pyriformis TaxID=342808 RepID=A0ABQ8UTE2_9EUKA|nr:hypothetical protein PAPYR_1291 [Paratrimastix pyriformis]